MALCREAGEGQFYVGKNTEMQTVFGTEVCKPLLIYGIILETLTTKCSAITKEIGWRDSFKQPD